MKAKAEKTVVEGQLIAYKRQTCCVETIIRYLVLEYTSIMSTTNATDGASTAFTRTMEIVVLTDIVPEAQGYRFLGASKPPEMRSDYDGSKDLWHSVSNKITRAINSVQDHPDFRSWREENVTRNDLDSSCRRWRAKVKDAIAELWQEDAEVRSTAIKVKAHKPFGTFSPEAFFEGHLELATRAEQAYQDSLRSAPPSSGP